MSPAPVDRIAGLTPAELPERLCAEVRAAGLDPAATYATVVAAVAEDLPGPDVTSWATIPAEQRASADLVARQEGTAAGLFLVEMTFRHVLGHDVALVRHVADGAPVAPGEVLLSVTGPAALLLTAERTALNLIGRAGGVATATAGWVRALAGTGARVRDTRKTVPGWRALDKYAVRTGGGVNHRNSLSDEALVKDNHVLAAGGVVAAYERVRQRHPDVPVEVEVTTLAELGEALDAGVGLVLLDNMDPATLREAVALRDARRPASLLEASGGLTIAGAAEVAATGVDYVAVGALTHSAPVLDVALELRAPDEGGGR